MLVRVGSDRSHPQVAGGPAAARLPDGPGEHDREAEHEELPGAHGRRYQERLGQPDAQAGSLSAARRRLQRKEHLRDLHRRECRQAVRLRQAAAHLRRPGRLRPPGLHVRDAVVVGALLPAAQGGRQGALLRRSQASTRSPGQRRAAQRSRHHLSRLQGRSRGREQQRHDDDDDDDEQSSHAQARHGRRRRQLGL